MSISMRLVAEPKAKFRGRYPTEIRPELACRFLRADPNPGNFDYPTLKIKISRQCTGRQYYIRVTSITVQTKQAPVTCVHPYPLITREANVISDSERNALYFLISDDELTTGYKSFRIICNKLPQYELRKYGALRILNTDEKDVSRVRNLFDARELIDTYRLGTSRLVFSIAELIYGNQMPVTYDATTIYSNIMTDVSSSLSASINKTLPVRYTPQKGDQNGGYEMLMVIPKINRKRPYQIHLHCEQPMTIHSSFVDLKTVSLQIPPCPMPVSRNKSVQMPIVVTQNKQEIARVIFSYQSTDQCQFCELTSALDSPGQSSNNDQDSPLDMFWDDMGSIINFRL